MDKLLKMRYEYDIAMLQKKFAKSECDINYWNEKTVQLATDIRKYERELYKGSGVQGMELTY